MNIVVLLAGGIGTRLGLKVPKQYVNVFGKPLIVYALEQYQKSNCIDAIEVVCARQYEEKIWGWAEQYAISKLKWIVTGGSSCQESTRNGIFNLEDKCSPEDVLTVNMSTSVFVDDDILEDSFRVCREYGCAFSAMQCIYNNAETFDGISSQKIHFKETHKMLNMPWTAPLGVLAPLYHEAMDKNIEMGQTSYMPTLFLKLGKTLYFSKDNALNQLHVVRPEELRIVSACLKDQIERGER